MSHLIPIAGSSRSSSPYPGTPPRMRTYTSAFFEAEDSMGSIGSSEERSKTPKRVRMSETSEIEMKVEALRVRNLYCSQEVLDILMVECTSPTQFSEMSELVQQLEGKGTRTCERAMAFLKEVLIRRMESPIERVQNHMEALEVLGESQPGFRLFKIYDFLTSLQPLDEDDLEIIFTAGEPLLQSVQEGDEKLKIFQALISTYKKCNLFKVVEHLLEFLKPEDLRNSELVVEFLLQITVLCDMNKQEESDRRLALARIFIPITPPEQRLAVLHWLDSLRYDLPTTDMDHLEQFQNELRDLGTLYNIHDALTDFIAIPERSRVDALLDIEKMPRNERAQKFYKMRLSSSERIAIGNRIHRHQLHTNTFTNQRLIFISIAAVPEEYRDRAIVHVKKLIDLLQPTDIAGTFHHLMQNIKNWKETHYQGASQVKFLTDPFVALLQPLLRGFRDADKLDFISFCQQYFTETSPSRLYKILLIAQLKCTDMSYSQLSNYLMTLRDLDDATLDSICGNLLANRPDILAAFAMTLQLANLNF